MPDSQQPPLWGPAYDERDLDAVLSGDTAGIPVPLQPVVSTLAALGAAATGRELSDEATVRAAFRAFAAETAPAAEDPAVTARTLILGPPDDRRASAGRRRHRHRRPAPGGVRKPRVAVTVAASAALIVSAVAVTCVLGGVGSITSSFGRPPASASASAGSARPSPGSQGLLATGATSDRTTSAKKTAPTPTPTTPPPTPDPGSMCRQLFQYLVHPTPGGAAGERALYGNLGKLAGSDSSFKIRGYCLRVLSNLDAGRWSWPAGPYGGGHWGVSFPPPVHRG
jgi:hypothetical protein